MNKLKVETIKLSNKDLEFICDTLSKPIVINDKLKKAYEQYNSIVKGNNNAAILK